MIGFGLSFHHLGLAVRAPQMAFCFLSGLGYGAGAEIFDPARGLNLAMRHHPHMPDVEVIWPGQGHSPIDNLLNRGDGLIYHLCYAAEAAGNALAAMAAAGLDVVDVCEPQPAALFDGMPVSFHQIGGFGLIELIHMDGRTGLAAGLR